MTIKTLLSAAILTVLPAISFAMCGGEARHDQQAMTCAEGTQWDAASGTCTPVTTS